MRASWCQEAPVLLSLRVEQQALGLRLMGEQGEEAAVPARFGRWGRSVALLRPLVQQGRLRFGDLLHRTQACQILQGARLMERGGQDVIRRIVMAGGKDVTVQADQLFKGRTWVAVCCHGGSERGGRLWSWRCGRARGVAVACACVQHSGCRPGILMGGGAVCALGAGRGSESRSGKGCEATLWRLSTLRRRGA